MRNDLSRFGPFNVLFALALFGCSGDGEGAETGADVDAGKDQAAFEATRAAVEHDEEADEVVITVTTEPGATVSLDDGEDLAGRIVFDDQTAVARTGKAKLRGRFGKVERPGPFQVTLVVKAPSGRRTVSVDLDPPVPSVSAFELEGGADDGDAIKCAGTLDEDGRSAVPICKRKTSLQVPPGQWVVRFVVQAATGKAVNIAGQDFGFDGGVAKVDLDLAKALAVLPLDKVLADGQGSKLELPVTVTHGRGASKGTLTLETDKVTAALERLGSGPLVLTGEAERPDRKRTMYVGLPSGVHSKRIVGPAKTLADIDLVVIDEAVPQAAGSCRAGDGTVVQQMTREVRAVAFDRRSGRRLGERRIVAPRPPPCPDGLAAGEALPVVAPSADGAWEWAFTLLDAPRPETPPGPFELAADAVLGDAADEMNPAFAGLSPNPEAVRTAWKAFGLDPHRDVDTVIKALGKPTRSMPDLPFDGWRLEYPGLWLTFDGQTGLLRSAELEARGAALGQRLAPRDLLAGLVGKPLSAWTAALGQPTSGRTDPRWAMRTESMILMVSASCQGEARCDSVTVSWTPR